MAANCVGKGLSHPILTRMAREFNEGALFQGSWTCCGAGEVVCDVLFYNPILGNDEVVGELSGDNGQNSFYNPSGETWSEGICDKSDEWHNAVHRYISTILFSEEARLAEEKRFIKEAARAAERKRRRTFQSSRMILGAKGGR